ncbi:MAG: hypothetical protein L6R37_005119 [Teloschistes peruensis]|nr:MAG: hypothetical protein L6R37_005119 [Teloschistes peruensis]
MATVPSSSIPIYGPPSGHGPVVWNHSKPIAQPSGILPVVWELDTPASSTSASASPSPSMNPVLADPPTQYFSPQPWPDAIEEEFAVAIPAAAARSPLPVIEPSPIDEPKEVIATLAYRIAVHRLGEDHHYSNGTSTSTNGMISQSNSSSSTVLAPSGSAKPTAILSTAAAAKAVGSEEAATTGSKVGMGMVLLSAVTISVVVAMMGS